ncbi:hypothetical protein [Ornithinimicrobium panacihumi]|uniref:hypothetical protein n=1 Tax=Ornithinimicrobium panacihumi TaxID=2008449 RepID=UPI003F89DB95
MPFVTTSKLFASPLSKYLDDRMERLRRGVLSADLEQLTEEAVERKAADRLVPPTLLRERARYDTDSSGSSIRVSLTVPIAGEAILLQYFPEGGAWSKAPTVRLTDNPAWAGGDEDEEGQEMSEGAVTFTVTFHPNATAEEIRMELKGLIDKVEAILGATADQVESHNNRAAHAVRQQAKNRREALTNATSLADELGRGI